MRTKNPPLAPILVIGFNRPRALRSLLQRIRGAPHTRLYVAIDGPRPAHREDPFLVQECREMVDELRWPTPVRRLFQEYNLGCGAGVTAAISWFFQHEEQGIILEDDLLPDRTFVPFCTELLHRYAHDDRVFAISGSNVVPPQHQTNPEMPYRFSRVPHVWGWATWQRSWEQHRLDLDDWREQLDPLRLWHQTGGSLTGTLFWGGFFDLVRRGQLDTWDVQLVFATMRSGQLVATSNVNLTENTGGGVDATHEHATAYTAQPVQSAVLPLADIPVEWDARADEWTRTHHFQAAVKARQALTVRDPYFRGFIDDIRRISGQ